MTVVAKGSFVFDFFYNTYQALLADQLGSFGKAAGFGKLFGKLSAKKHQQFKKQPKMHKMKNIVISSISFFFIKSHPLDASHHLCGITHLVDGAW